MSDLGKKIYFDAIGVGTAVVDYLGVVPHYPAPDSQLGLQSLQRQGGGNVSTTLATLARLGASACFLGKLGDDELGRFALASLRETGVDVSHVIIEPGASAGFAFIIVDASSCQRTILWSNQNKPRFGGAELDAQQVVNARFLVLDEYEMEAAIAAARIARTSARKITIALDAESGLAGIETLLPLADVIIASEDFAINHSGAGGADFKAAARGLYTRFPAATVVVTAGERGCYCAAGTGAFYQPAFRVRPVDTTGCGDVFRGAFSYGLLQGWELAQIAEFASAAAALNCRALGGRAGIPSLPEVQHFLAGQRTL